MSDKVKMFAMPEIEGLERARALFLIPAPSGNIAYTCYRWGKFSTHWLLELPAGQQIEVYNQSCIIHVPQPGFTFELDGTYREVAKEDLRVVLQ